MPNYPKLPDFETLGNLIRDYSTLKVEEGAQGVAEILSGLDESLIKCLEKLKNLEGSKALALEEPNSLEEIRKLRPHGPRRMPQKLSKVEFLDKLKGGFYSRLAGCTLGAPVEFWSVDDMKNWADYCAEPFPPVDYWSKTKHPNEIRYTKGDFVEYTKENLDKVPVDDDIAYTLLGLMVMEKYGLDFTTEDVAEAWKVYLPMAYTAELITLDHLKEGISVHEACEKDNPYSQWIGADIRIDSYGYVTPGNPEKAAELAYRDAILSHRRNGVYGAMFFAAAIAAAFVSEDTIDAIEIGLTEIPQNCLLAQDIKWALQVREQVKDYKDARSLVDQRFEGMSHAHTNNNACLTIFGLHIGGSDIGKVIAETVAMGMDNDCTAATAGSIAGIVYGVKNLGEHWYLPFNDTIDTYLNGINEFKISDVLERYIRLAQRASEFEW
ncbi:MULTISPECIES: ADP-ribosylglycohydrolase family protein [unclassified Fusibacter]|uniref:ADP-ribosylglycohydrolase family protein n=1 Tax=unclassified Fusibacter TaxID=2624464 RepID=UPI0010100AE4|nr:MULTISPECIES: ADP-ribosylglycohydrolase family protein [unclassified Fusibacter]MCK8060276.1 ADP-ribosylglycohydrolase family protein [Fusibacter sp. A2]NPE20435.1 ADP-ribosylglycohydrolase family protein [Fusibacter sp. A1]RXV63640.1 ADP-ribosylglycohydrolase family protein [Fusibacter sp. A1]